MQRQKWLQMFIPKIIDEDRRFNAQKMDKEFYSTLNEDTGNQQQDTGFSDDDMALLELI